MKGTVLFLGIVLFLVSGVWAGDSPNPLDPPSLDDLTLEERVHELEFKVYLMGSWVRRMEDRISELEVCLRLRETACVEDDPDCEVQRWCEMGVCYDPGNPVCEPWREPEGEE
jgi:hypothetical protein